MGLTPYEHIGKCWTSEPQRFALNPIHHMPALNNQNLAMAHRPGSARLLTPDNTILDPRPNLCDTAFAALSLSWLYRATNDDGSHDLAFQTLDFIEKRRRHPSGSGFQNALLSEGPRLPNPLMQLLEACIAGFEASGDLRFERMAREMVAMFKTRLFEVERGTLGEYLDHSWNRALDDAGRVVEPGHHCAWAWILAASGRRCALPVETEMRALGRFAERQGVDTADAVRNSVRGDGTVLDGGLRAWPNTKRIKAAVALSEALGDDTLAMLDQSLNLLIDRQLHADGGWTDAFDADGRPIARAMPVSTFYHVFLAIAEAVRATASFEGRPH